MNPHRSPARRTSVFGACALVMVLLAGAACGSDEDAADEPTTQPSTTVAASLTTVATTTLPTTTELVTTSVTTTLLETTVPTTEASTTTVEVTTTEAPTTIEAPPTTVAATVPPTAPPAPTTGKFLTVGPSGTLGMWDADAGGVWVDDVGEGDGDDVPVAPGDTFRVFTIDGLEGTATVTGVDLVCEFSDSYGPILDPALGFDFDGTPSPVAINAPWDVQPRPAEVLDPASPEWIAPVQQQLTALGVGDEPVRVVEAIGTDLDGNGSMEVVLVAQNPDIDPMVAPPAGYYSIVMVLRPDGTEVVTSLLANAVYLEDQEFPSFVDFTLQSFSDLNGDGTMEVLIDYSVWEGAGTYVYEVIEGIDPELVIAGGCGS